MKILLINHFPLKGSGSGIYVADIAKSLTERGHNVCIIMPENTTKITGISNVKIHPVFFKGNESEKIKESLSLLRDPDKYWQTVEAKLSSKNESKRNIEYFKNQYYATLSRKSES